jgi:hypothetical protein
MRDSAREHSGRPSSKRPRKNVARGDRQRPAFADAKDGAGVLTHWSSGSLGRASNPDGSVAGNNAITVRSGRQVLEHVAISAKAENQARLGQRHPRTLRGRSHARSRGNRRRTQDVAGVHVDAEDLRAPGVHRAHSPHDVAGEGEITCPFASETDTDVDLRDHFVERRVDAEEMTAGQQPHGASASRNGRRESRNRNLDAAHLCVRATIRTGGNDRGRGTRNHSKQHNRTRRRP